MKMASRVMLGLAWFIVGADGAARLLRDDYETITSIRVLLVCVVFALLSIAFLLQEALP